MKHVMVGFEWTSLYHNGPVVAFKKDCSFPALPWCSQYNKECDAASSQISAAWHFHKLPLTLSKFLFEASCFFSLIKKWINYSDDQTSIIILTCAHHINSDFQKFFFSLKKISIAKKNTLYEWDNSLIYKMYFSLSLQKTERLNRRLNHILLYTRTIQSAQ